MLSPFIRSSILRNSANSLGWRPLTLDKHEGYQGDTPTAVSRSLINIVHVTDTHICDAQSPARVEYLDRFADPHHPLSKKIGSLVGTYRAQESLTTQVLESAIQSINRIEITPITKRKIDVVLVTGDVTDNAQQNELSWFTTLLNGGMVRPDSGNRSLWEGVGGSLFYSPFFWHPHGTPKSEIESYPVSLYGFPIIPELLDAVRDPFYASGLNAYWLAVHGNHDALLQGTVVPDEMLRSEAVKNRKIFELEDEEALIALSNVTEVGPASYPVSDKVISVEVSPDQSRDFLQPESWNGNFYREDEDNGITMDEIGTSKRYWRKDFEAITILALDTVNPNGGWQGSIDQAQMNWLEDELESLRHKYVVITSHHPLHDLINGYSLTDIRVLRDEIEALLMRHPQVIAWVCGHSHRNRMTYFGPDHHHGFWQIETSSLIDWPQQCRIIEIFTDQFDQVWIANTAINHLGTILPDYDRPKLDEVQDLAGLSRALAANDWQRRSGEFSIDKNEGSLFDRNGIVVLPRRV
jgi:metallophosphoesterase (TIGR03767 family)